MYKNLPNILTIFRLILAPVFSLVYLSHYENSQNLAFIIFFIVGLTDIFDGYLARKYNLISSFGVAMDPLADKVMLIFVFISFAIRDILPLWIIIFIIVKELIMIISGIYFYYKKEKLIIPSNIFGKTATMLMFISIIGVILEPRLFIFIYMVYFSIFLKILAFYSYLRVVKMSLYNKSK